ncbi:hypothetical protein [Robbsia sp. KACC 23696]|uniref:hypothetical protein n=1 Tax=Robbsia sp. KACC 23696 TaxID=3149231 RepID=UPI00325BB9AD
MQTTVTVKAKIAWWARPAAYCAAYAMLPFVGVDRALFYAAKVLCRGVRVTAQ